VALIAQALMHMTRLDSKRVRMNSIWAVDTRRYPFEISVKNPEFVKVGRTGHDLRELKVIKDRKTGIHGEQGADSPTANGLLLGWIWCIPSRSHFASSQIQYGNTRSP